MRLHMFILKRLLLAGVLEVQDKKTLQERNPRMAPYYKESGGVESPAFGLFVALCNFLK